jgi:hypothetical protein
MKKASELSTKDKLRWTTSYNLPESNWTVVSKSYADWKIKNPTITVDRTWWTQMVLSNLS